MDVEHGSGFLRINKTGRIVNDFKGRKNGAARLSDGLCRKRRLWRAEKNPIGAAHGVG
ncbi:hypothetical protein HMPREF9120_01715 [Neisseria sp. oral taxon 020 str. F0370]|nr:hypothetical protein HMPREF9120_01715 [Neisseria sp. oral taxon 020 str. F0370]